VSRPTSKASILIVEDDSIIAWHLRAMVTSMGYDVCATVATQDGAVAAAAAYRPAAILMDVRLAAGGDGVKAAEDVRAVQDTAIIFCTAHAQDPSFKGRIAKFDAPVLDKPVEELALADALRKALGHGRAP
jgi:CheY-like chemotaxis protein